MLGRDTFGWHVDGRRLKSGLGVGITSGGMVLNAPIELEGYLSLEGPLLESIVALHLMVMGHGIVPRRSSYGVHHDILVGACDGYVFYECTGQGEITVEKIDRFRNDALKLKERLEKIESRTLRKCVFVAAVSDDSWSRRARETFKETVERLKSEGCEVELVGGTKLLKQLMLSGSLGFRLYLNKVYFAGPEDYAVRFDHEHGEFRVMYPKVLLESFRGTPFSTLPSHYWEMFYQRRLIDTLKKEYEELLEPLWTYYGYLGLKWKSIRDLVACYREYLCSLPREYASEIDGEENWLFATWRSRRHWYYELHAFSIDEIVDKKISGSLCGRADALIHRLKKEGRIPRKGKVRVRIHTFTDCWTAGGWDEFHERLEAFEREASLSAERGNEMLVELLNSGVLGIRFKKKNLITLYGSGIPAIRRTWSEDRRKYTLDFVEKPATL